MPLHLLITILSLNLVTAGQTQPSGEARFQANPDKAEQVLSAFANAIGGLAAFDNIKTSLSKGNATDWEGRRFEIETYTKDPDMQLCIEHTAKGEVRRGYEAKLAGFRK